MDRSIFHMKSDNVYENLTGDVEQRLNTSNYRYEKPLPIGKKKLVRLMKDGLGRKKMKEFVALRPKM